MATNNILSFGTANNTKISESKQINGPALKVCRTIIATTLPKCFVFLNDLDDILFKLADKAESNQEQEEFFVAMRQFRVNKEQLQKDFTKLILDEFNTVCSSSSPSSTEKQNRASASNLELSILDNESLEEDIAVDRIAIKVESLFGHNFTQLEERLAHAIGATEITDNPLSPTRISEQLKNILEPLGLSLEIKIVAYKHFEQRSVAEVGNLYKQLNNALIKEGMLPNLDQRKPQTKTTSAPAASPTPKPKTEPKATSTPPQESFGSEDNAEDPAQFFEGLRQYLNKPQAPQGDPSLPVAEPASVMNALSDIQNKPTNNVSFDANGTPSLPDVRQILMDNLSVTQSDGSVTQQAISRLDEDAMDLIDLLFEFILDDRAIPAPIRAMLARLQIPLLKIALNDKQIFSKKSHPARRLLNSLATASTGWSQRSDLQQDKLQTEVDRIVNTVLEEFETDIQLFIDLNTQFDEFISQLNRTSQAAEQRIVQTNEGKERLLAAQQDVDTIISEQLAGHDQLPRVVMAIIDDGWKHVLKLRWLQKGKTSKEWRASVELLQQLIWSVSPKLEADDRKQLLTIIPTMLKSLREGLSGASFNQHKISALFKELQQCHVKCMNGTNLPTDELQEVVSLPPEALAKPELESLPSIDDDKKVVSDKTAMQRAKELKIGTWLEIARDGDTPPQRIKFSWRSNLTGRCLFVTYQGAKAAEIAIGELAGWFQQGKVLEIDQATPLMDRALVSMMDTVNT